MVTQNDFYSVIVLRRVNKNCSDATEFERSYSESQNINCAVGGIF